MSKIISCPKCGKKFGIFRHRHNCDCCFINLCSNCLIGVPEFIGLEVKPFKASYKNVCSSCNDKIIKPVVEKYEKAIIDSKSVSTYPITYQGKIKDANDSSKYRITTDFYRDKDFALEVLKITAAFLGYDIIYDIKYEKETVNDDNYFYSIWSAMGIGTKKV